jgi:hypothetical protein
MNLRFVLFVICIGISFESCKKENLESLQVLLHYKVDNQPLLFDTMAYNCEAGYQYEVTRLYYYVSNFRFIMDNGTEYQDNTVYYVDASKKLTFYIGLDSLQNKTDYLPATFDNINMGWPDAMGGGYHFMKLEGLFRDSSSTSGYAMHLGKNQFVVPIEVPNPIIVTKQGKKVINLTMNIAEWFRNPEVYDFKINGSYSMNSDAAMHVLSVNGKDVFN